jgi:hypothetical protein
MNEEPKYNIRQKVFTINKQFKPGKVICPACEGKNNGKVLLLDGKWYDCPNCNLPEDIYAMPGLVFVGTGRNVRKIEQVTIEGMFLAKRKCLPPKGKGIVYADSGNHVLHEEEIFDTREEAEAEVKRQEQEEKENA